MTDSTRNLIDFAANDDAVAFRQALYASIHDRVSAHLENHKQKLAQHLIVPEETTAEDETTEEQTEDEENESVDEETDLTESESAHPDEKEDKSLVKKMVKKDCLKDGKKD